MGYVSNSGEFSIQFCGSSYRLVTFSDGLLVAQIGRFWTDQVKNRGTRPESRALDGVADMALQISGDGLARCQMVYFLCRYSML